MGLYGNESVDELNPGYVVTAYDETQTKLINALIAARLAARRAKDFKESDRIRDELAGMGITLKDAKNKDTGDIETTWEVAR